MITSHPPPKRIDESALTVAMALAPGVYSRNRMFGLYEDPAVRRAKARAAILRGAVRQLAGVHGAANLVSMVRSAGRVAVRYRVEALRLDRRLELSELEAACFVYLATRAGVPRLHAGAEERALVDAALRRLAVGLELSTIDAAGE